MEEFALLYGVLEFGAAGFSVLQLKLAHHAVFPLLGQVEVGMPVPARHHNRIISGIMTSMTPAPHQPQWPPPKWCERMP